MDLETWTELMAFVDALREAVDQIDRDKIARILDQLAALRAEVIL